MVIDRATTQFRLIRTLRGLTPEFASFNDTEFDEGRFEKHLEEGPRLAIAACWYWIRKLQARFFAGDYASAIAAAANAERLLWTSPSFFEVAEYHLYAALTRATLCDAASAAERTKHLEALAAHHRQLQEWAENCPETFANRAALVAAEIARLEGREFDAERLYEQAIRSADTNEFGHNKALANEIAARFYAAHGFEKIAHVYLQEARHGYLRWGADGKVRQLDLLYPHLAAAQGQRPAAIGGSALRHLDAASVAKASRALSGEMVLPRLIEQLVRIAMEHAGAERGLLILVRDGEPRIEAEASTGPDGIKVAVRQAPVTVSDLPRSALHYVLRTQEDVLLHDALADSEYSKDEYVRQKCARSVLCLPIVKQGKLVGALYLENNLAPLVFTPDRVAVLQLLASQAAISLENASLYSDLQLQAGLLQRLPVSAWTLNPDGTPDFVNQVWLDLSGQTLDYIRSRPEAWMTAIHPEDREAAATAFWKGVRTGQGFAFETRTLRARDQTYRWHLQQAVVLHDADGKVLKFVGTTTDIDDQKRAEQGARDSERRYHEIQLQLAHANRVETMGHLSASIAHELNQPLSGAVVSAETALLWLSGDQPDIAEAQKAVTRVVRDSKRASEVFQGIRALVKKAPPQKERLDINEVIRDIIGLTRAEAARNHVRVKTRLEEALPAVKCDRVHLQQVTLNLIMNALDALKGCDSGARDILISTAESASGEVQVCVQDSGPGIEETDAERIFEAFYTTKPHGLGMGLSICRSIIESHGGRLWAAAGASRGATFQFTVPVDGGRPVPNSSRTH